MQEQPVIMVLIADPKWTRDVLCNACAWARRYDGRISIVRMVRVQHILYLGTQAGYMALDEQQLCELQAYADLVAQCGLACEVQVYQCHDVFKAIRDTAVQMGASAVFAKLPSSIIPFWSECRFEVLRRHLERDGIEIYDRPVYALVEGQLLSRGDGQRMAAESHA